ncbi:MAG: 2,3-bisphosphoglycerate-independent phosphoglycerate mutase [Caldisericia bacterium]|nr:2,3-bisphosphoglycerate-independent phosphoglycerate mutase [Caldisericia bacterium]
MNDRKVLLLILDGFGIAPPSSGNVCTLACTPNIDKLRDENPHSQLDTSGLNVGLPKGQMGNSEVGHLNLGAGRIVYQKLTLIDKAVEDGSLAKNKVLLEAIDKAKNSKLHLAGLCSNGGVHSELEHLYEIVKIARDRGVKNIFLHAFLDGRDTPPASAVGFIEEIQDKFKALGAGKIATISGRFYAMDRDNRWDRTKKAYDCMVSGVGQLIDDPVKAIEESYSNGVTDEFIEPMVVAQNGKPLATIDDGDSFIHFNFRPDRARQIARALTAKEFTGFARDKFPKITFTCFALYDESLNLPIVFTDDMLTQDIDMTLGKAISDAGLTQLRIAETEKYAHVTYFFNGGREEPYPGEDRILVPSPKVATYDLQPEMSGPEVVEKLSQAMKSGKYNFIACNLANPDMVGHTGNIPAAIKAVRFVDKATKQIADVAKEFGYNMVVISDHGNVEQLLDGMGNVHTAHTTNMVPLILIPVNEIDRRELAPLGTLADVTGLLLHLLGIRKPPQMKDSVFTK